MSEAESLEQQAQAAAQQAQAIADMAHDVHLAALWLFLILVALIAIAVRMPKRRKDGPSGAAPEEAGVVKAQIASMVGRKGLFTGAPFMPVSGYATSVEAVVEDCDDEWVRLRIDSKKGSEVRIVRIAAIASVEEIVANRGTSR